MAEQVERSSLRKKRLAYMAVWVLALFVVLAVILFQNRPKSPWAPTTMAYDDCGDKCIDLGSRNIAHIGEVQFYYDPDVDDPVAQWAGCLDTIVTCVSAGSRDDAQLLGTCVAASACPVSCKTHFAKGFNAVDSPQAQLDQIEKTFLTEGVICNPRE